MRPSLHTFASLFVISWGAGCGAAHERAVEPVTAASRPIPAPPSSASAAPAAAPSAAPAVSVTKPPPRAATVRIGSVSGTLDVTSGGLDLGGDLLVTYEVQGGPVDILRVTGTMSVARVVRPFAATPSGGSDASPLRLQDGPIGAVHKIPQGALPDVARAACGRKLTLIEVRLHVEHTAGITDAIGIVVPSCGGLI